MGNVHMEATQINYRGGASKMNVEEAIKSAIELTPEQKTNINKIPTIEAAVGNKTDQVVIASEFDAEAGVYSVGDLVMHEGKLYEFTSAHETAGDWNAEEVSEKTVSDEIDTLKSGLTNVSTLPAYISVFKVQTLASQGTATVSFSQSDFTVPSGYIAYWNTPQVSVVGNWNVAVDYTLAYSNGDNVISANNNLNVFLKAPVTGGDITVNVYVTIQIGKSS